MAAGAFTRRGSARRGWNNCASQACGAVPETVRSLKNDFVLALTGYHPDVELLRRAGVEVEPRRLRPCCDPETLESSVPGLYLAGVIIAGLDTNEIFIANGRFHAQQIVPDMAAKL